MNPEQLQQLDQRLPMAGQSRRCTKLAGSVSPADTQVTLSPMALENEPISLRRLEKLLNQPVR